MWLFDQLAFEFSSLIEESEDLIMEPRFRDTNYNVDHFE